jgi:hypothetical protein
MGFEKYRKDGIRGWIIPSLAEARARWDEVRWPGEWDDNNSWDFWRDESQEQCHEARQGDAQYDFDSPY